MAGIRALLGLFPKTGKYESKRNQLENEYKALIAFKSSKELRQFRELEEEINSEDFAKRKKEIFSLRYKNTDDYQKEQEFIRLKNSSDIKLYYLIHGFEQLKKFQSYEKSAELKKFHQLEEFISSKEFSSAREAASVSSKQKFINSELYKPYEQYHQLKQNAKIIDYYKFQGSKYFAGYTAFINSKQSSKLKELEKEIKSGSSVEKNKLDVYKEIRKSKDYKHYMKLVNSPAKNNYEKVADSDELEAYLELEKYINSDEFKRKRKEVESRTFKDTKEYASFLDYQNLKNSSSVKSYFKFKDSKAYKNYLALKGSDRISKFEALNEHIESEEFTRFKAYCLKSPKKRWLESKEFETFNEYVNTKKSEKIKWFLNNIESPKFEWFRQWEESFFEDFSSGKLDKGKWLTKYYYGDKILKDSYSLSSDKHLITDGKNLKLENGKLHIITRKENVTGKSWDASRGFLTREFGYTSGLVSTGESFRQKYGTFEAKIKIHSSKKIRNAFWMVGKLMVPHIDIANAGKKLVVGNAWKNSTSIQRFTDSVRRNILMKDYYIFSLEWTSDRLRWKINGVEIANTTHGVPDEPMYLLLSAGLETDVKSELLPADFEIDWVRCFKQSVPKKIKKSKPE